MSEPGERHILHVDMDAFFAAIEQLDRPELRGKPVLVGGSPTGRGVVSTASYEARPFGCHSAMPMARAVRLCPQAIVVRPRMRRYAEVSRQVLEIAGQFTPLVEPLSIDEAFLDVTGSTRLLGPAGQIARELKRRIREKTHLTASVGLAPNKFLAKLGSDMEKPDGLVIVRSDGVRALLDPLPISRLWGVGKATLPKLEALGVRTFGDLGRFSEMALRNHFGEAGEHFYRLVRGIDDRGVVPDREAKSISHEVTFSVDIDDYDHLRAVLLGQTEHVAHRLRRHGRLARVVTLKVRLADFSTITRSTTLAAGSDRTDVLWDAVAGLFESWSGPRSAAVRLIGMGVSQLSTEEGQQLDLFDQDEVTRRRGLDQTIDQIRRRFGDDAVSRGKAPG
ncbi:MAG: DNA polymerase IV [Planctomycetota bacterium]|jgi:DNA polymerase-4